MRFGWVMAGVVLGACRGEPSAPGSLIRASCSLADDNSLRAWCDVQGASELVVSAEGDEVGRFAVRDGRAGVWGLAPETAYTWSVSMDGETVEGTLTTGAVPTQARFDWTQSGAASMAEVLHVGVCEGTETAVMTRTEDGAVLWYETFPDAERFVGFERTEDDTLLGVAGPGLLVERTWMGEELLRVEALPGTAFHHDATRWNGMTFVLFQTYVGDLQLDGFEVIGPGGERLARWDLSDHWVPSPDRADDDVSHANSIQIRDGIALISFRKLSTVLAVVADPERPDFGEILWRLEGEPPSGWQGADVQLADGEVFQLQHDARWVGDQLTLFDNGRPGTDSRGLVMDVDLASGLATVVDEVSTERGCRYQGAMRDTDAGWLLTCSPLQTVVERGDGSPSWEATVTCASGETGVLPRMLPVR